eukprot:scaffold153975_cov21-Tisochrysis_lutea.AAC.1
MDASLLWKKLARSKNLGSKRSDCVAGDECSLVPPCPPLLLNGHRELVLGTIGTTSIASRQLE